MTPGLKGYPAMKDSGVPWLGEVPDHWEVTSGRAYFIENHRSNIGLAETTVLSLSYGNIVVKPQEKLHGLVPTSFETYQIVEPGEIVCRPTDLQNDKTSLRFGFCRTRGIITSAYMCLRTREELDQYFGYLLLHAYDLKKIFYGLGSGLRQNLDWRDFKNLPCLVPPLAEQAAIVRFLDHYDRKIRRYIRAKQKLIKLLEEQKQAIIHRAVTRGLDPNVHLKPSGVKWLGEIPEHWEVRRAKAVCSAIIDCKNRTPEAVDDGAYIVVRTTCIRNGQFDPNGGYKTDEKNYLVWTARGAPHAGDVFFTREAPAGEACLVPERDDLCMGQRMMYFRPDPELLDPQFLLLNIYGPLTRTHVELSTNGSTVGHLRLGQVYALPILWCPLQEQQAIIKGVDQATQHIDLTRVVAQREISLLREYRTRLIADVVTGKLDVRCVKLPAEEDAEALDELDTVEDIDVEEMNDTEETSDGDD
jgi:type I restriction enzyme, S subunit